jgi:hypothetical protein
VRYSYSRISKYNQCPKAFYYQYIEESVEYTSSPEAAYGSEMHLFIDEHMQGLAEITLRTEFLRPLLTKLKSIKGEVKTEYGLGFREDRSQTTFDDKEAFVIGKSDCTIFHPSEPKIKIYDWKFSKKTDPTAYRVEMDMFVWLHHMAHPEVETIETGLVWLKTPAPTSIKIYGAAEFRQAESDILQNIEKIEDSICFEKWPCKTSGLCWGWCSCTQCDKWHPKKEKK